MITFLKSLFKRKQKPRLYTYQEVLECICPACRDNVPSVWVITTSGTFIYHVVDGVQFTCHADRFRFNPPQ